jgi:hypothetical protein
MVTLPLGNRSCILAVVTRRDYTALFDKNKTEDYFDSPLLTEWQDGINMTTITFDTLELVDKLKIGRHPVG